MYRDDPKRSGHEPCKHFLLARGAGAQVEYCAACAIFHLNLDALSLRFRATALRDLRDTLATALAAYEQAVAQAEERAAQDAREGLH